MAQQNKQTIAVIGAGILGITSAIALQERLPSSKYQIAIIASHFPTDPYNPSYATTNAGAHFRPIPGTTPQLKFEAGLAQVAYDRFKKTAIERPEFGVRLLEGIEYVSGEATPTYTAMVPDYVNRDGFKLLEGAEKPAGAEFAASYQSYTVDPETYTFHLLRQFRIKGGQLLRMHLHSAEEVYKLPNFNVSLVVNCSGMGFGDPKSFIIRGQTCLIAKTCDHTVTQQNADGSWTFIVPRPLKGGTIVGGTKEPKDWNPTPSIEVRKELIRKVAKMYPAILNEDGQVDVVRDVVGRRPAREGGLRLEIERVDNQKDIVHAYGAGGRGFELSWGIAEKVVAMVDKALPVRSQL